MADLECNAQCGLELLYLAYLRLLFVLASRNISCVCDAKKLCSIRKIVENMRLRKVFCSQSQASFIEGSKKNCGYWFDDSTVNAL